MCGLISFISEFPINVSTDPGEKPYKQIISEVMIR